jgi:hypothetical protein
VRKVGGRSCQGPDGREPEGRSVVEQMCGTSAVA